MGRQENKDAKLAGIRSAARELFTTKGFDATSVADVAERAGVAKGTVFLYAEDKADLLALVFEDALLGVSRDAIAALDLDRPLHEELAKLFSRFFDVYEPQPALARLVVRELAFARGHAARVRQTVDRELLAGVAAHVEARKDRGDIARDVTAMAVATNAFAIYFLTLLGWLSGLAPTRAFAERYLAGSLELATRGLRLSAPARPIAVPRAIAPLRPPRPSRKRKKGSKP